jgi:hypothetical protein
MKNTIKLLTLALMMTMATQSLGMSRFFRGGQTAKTAFNSGKLFATSAFANMQNSFKSSNLFKRFAHTDRAKATQRFFSPAKTAGIFGLFGVASCYKFSQKESFEKPLNKNGFLSIDNPTGSITIQGWDQDRLDIQATKKASTKKDLDETKVELESTPDKAKVCTLLPKQWLSGATIITSNGNTLIADGVVVVGKGSVACVNGKCYTSDDASSNCTPAVDYLIKAPYGIDLEIQHGNAGVNVRDITGNIRTRGSNGATAIRGGNNVDSSTSNGSLEIRDAKKDVSAQTINGNLDVINTGGKVKAQTTNGVLNVRDAQGNVEAQTTNGELVVRDAQGEVSAETTIGAIALRNIFKKIWARTHIGSITVNDVQKPELVDAKSTIGTVTINGKVQR